MIIILIRITDWLPWQTLIDMNLVLYQLLVTGVFAEISLNHFPRLPIANNQKIPVQAWKLFQSILSHVQYILVSNCCCIADFYKCTASFDSGVVDLDCSIGPVGCMGRYSFTASHEASAARALLVLEAKRLGQTFW